MCRSTAAACKELGSCEAWYDAEEDLEPAGEAAETGAVIPEEETSGRWCRGSTQDGEVGESIEFDLNRFQVWISLEKDKKAWKIFVFPEYYSYFFVF